MGLGLDVETKGLAAARAVVFFTKAAHIREYARYEAGVRSGSVFSGSETAPPSLADGNQKIGRRAAITGPPF